MDEFENDHCPVCHKIVEIDKNPQLSESSREKYGSLVYVPGEEISDVILTSEQRKLRKEIEQLLEESRPEPIVFEEA